MRQLFTVLLLLGKMSNFGDAGLLFLTNLSLSVAEQTDTCVPDIFNNHLSFPSLHFVVYLFQEEGATLPCVFLWNMVLHCRKI